MRLKATKKSETALKALTLLSQANQPVSGSVLTKELETSSALLSQSLSPLIENNWIVSRPGPDGGYQLSPTLKKLSVLQVVEAIEGPLVNSECVVSDRRCGIDEPCSLHHVWATARSALRDSLTKRSAI